MKLRQILGLVLLLGLVGPRLGHAMEFNYKDLVLATIKLTPDYDYDTFVDSYMQVFRPAVWEKSHNDEFELKSKRAETIDLMKKAAAAFNMDDPIVIHTNVDFGEYDFKEKKFALSPFSGSTFFYDGYCCTHLPNQIKVYFTNPDFVNGIPMETDAAKAFLQKHKTNGYVNRRLDADINIKVKSLRTDSELDTEIVKVVIKDPARGNPIVMMIP